MGFQDHFSKQAVTYARARPTYPAALFEDLARLAPSHDLAWDAGAGNGQASRALAEWVTQVVATEPSAAQLAHAAPHPHVAFHQASETAPMLADSSVDLVTAAQAAHWFDRATFYAEVRRVLRPGGIVALWTYELCHISPPIDACVRRFYRGPIDTFWPPERRDVERGYRDWEFPFDERPFPGFFAKFAMVHEWSLGDFATYLRTWSAVTRFIEVEGHDPVSLLEAELEPLWGDGDRTVSWPLAGRIGRLSQGPG